MVKIEDRNKGTGALEKEDTESIGGFDRNLEVPRCVVGRCGWRAVVRVEKSGELGSWEVRIEEVLEEVPTFFFIFSPAFFPVSSV